MHDPSMSPVVDEEAVASRLALFRITPEVLARLAGLRSFAEQTTKPTVDRFYEHLMAQPETAAYLRDTELVVRLKNKQRAYFLAMFSGRVDPAYVADRLRVGQVHAQLGVAPQWYIGAFSAYLDVVHSELRAAKTDPAEIADDLSAVGKMMHFDASLAIDAYIAGHIELEQRHAEAIRELSTPVIRVHDRVLLLPLVGTLDADRARQVTEQVLSRIVQERAKVLLLDIAGVSMVDTHVADHLIKTTNAVRLLGAHPILTGISPQVARTVIELGVDLGQLHTRSTLAAGLDLALSLIRKRVVDCDEAGP